MNNLLPQISEAEFEVMKVIWDNFPVSTNLIVEILASSQNWSPKTIHTMLIRLEKKGAVCHKKEGRIFVYSPIVQKEDYINKESTNFLNRFFNGTFNQMVVSFLEQNKLSEDDIRELRDILNHEKKE